MPDWRDYRMWEFHADMNGDGAVTISDVWPWIKWLYFYPGDGVIYILGNTAVGRFFELSAASFGGFWSAVISLILWPFIWYQVFVAFPAELRRIDKLDEERVARNKTLPWYKRQPSSFQAVATLALLVTILLMAFGS